MARLKQCHISLAHTKRAPVEVLKIFSYNVSSMKNKKEIQNLPLIWYSKKESKP